MKYLNKLQRDSAGQNSEIIESINTLLNQLKSKNNIINNITNSIVKKAAEAVPAEANLNISDAYNPASTLIDACKGMINNEFQSFLPLPLLPPPPPSGEPYQGYLHTFGGHRVFTLKSYCPEGPPCQTFQPDHLQPPPPLYDIGSYDSDSDPLYDQYKKYYAPPDFDTQCLLQAILYRNIIKNQHTNSEINKLISSYTDDPDPDDLYGEAEKNIFDIHIVYGIVKRITAFIQTKNIADSMRYLTALKEWIAEEASQADNLEISQLLLKRIGIMTELLWHVLSKWPVRIPDCPVIAPEIAPVIAPEIGPCNVKLYAGIGTQISDANYEIFVAGLFSGIDLPNCFHNQAPQYPPVPNQQIISRDFVSSAYSFDAAAKFCKILKCAQPGQTNIFCMLEFILLPGKQLPFIGSSANEAEVLLKPGNVYQFIKRYKVKYVRFSTRGEEPMIIYIYQFLLTDDQNTLSTKNNIHENNIHENKKLKDGFDYSSHPNWSEEINAFVDELSRLAGISQRRIPTLNVTRVIGGSKRRSNKTKRQTNKRRRRKTRKTRRRRTMKTRRRI